MSTNLDLLSDSTFSTKLDTQNGILTDIKDGLTGGSNAVTAGTPDADSVVQLKKKDPVTGNDVNVYPVLAPASGLGRYLFPALPSEIDWTNWNSPECFISNSGTPTQQADIVTPHIYKRSFYLYPYVANMLLYIRRDIIDTDLNLNYEEAYRNMFININRPTTSIATNAVPCIDPYTSITVNNTEYFTFSLNNLTTNNWADAPCITIIV